MTFYEPFVVLAFLKIFILTEILQYQIRIAVLYLQSWVEVCLCHPLLGLVAVQQLIEFVCI